MAKATAQKPKSSQTSEPRSAADDAPAGCPAHQGAKPVDLPSEPASDVSPCGLTLYQIHPRAPEIRPAKAQRNWMDATPDRFAYRCLPLSIANATGWEMVLGVDLRAYWNGGDLVDDLKVEAVHRKDASYVNHTVGSHFGSGVLTFHTGYIMRTSPGWGMWARGAPNSVKDGIAPLDGLIETDWLPFPFTMNWVFTRPGVVEFKAGEVFCFVTPTPHHSLEEIQPNIVPLDVNPPLKADYDGWSQARTEFNAGLANGDPETVKQGWQRTYMHGKTLDGEKVPLKHASKRKMKKPAQL
ncbi:MAG: DUF6065 family protein [Devosiaceae bacterium]